MKSGVAAAIREAGGAVYAVTSEPHSLAQEAQEDWELDFETVGDPHHEILAATRDRGWLDLDIKKDTAHLKEIRDWVVHPKGHFQPGVLVVNRAGRVLYRWRCTPSLQNVGGAIVRPTPEHVWAQVQTRLDDTGSDEGADAPLDTTPDMDNKPVFWPMFMVFLLAHGWFFKPKPFPIGRKGERVLTPQQMLPRIAGLVLLLIGAFVVLPVWWAFSGVCAWLAFIAPAVVKGHRAFHVTP